MLSRNPEWVQDPQMMYRHIKALLRARLLLSFSVFPLLPLLDLDEFWAGEMAQGEGGLQA